MANNKYRLGDKVRVITIDEAKNMVIRLRMSDIYMCEKYGNEEFIIWNVVPVGIGVKPMYNLKSMTTDKVITCIREILLERIDEPVLMEIDQEAYGCFMFGEGNDK